jgi:hypothetical protein
MYSGANLNRPEGSQLDGRIAVAGDNSVAMEIARQTLQQAMADLDRAQAEYERLGITAPYSPEHRAAESVVRAAARRYNMAQDHLEKLDR